jgi:predicted acetyltransferase
MLCGSGVCFEVCVCEKYLEKQKVVFVALMDLQKAYDRVDRMAIWEVLRMYGVGGKSLSAIKSMYENIYRVVQVNRNYIKITESRSICNISA